MPRIFLAHASEDKEQVRKLYADLKARGFDPWLDEIDLMPGQIWKTEIPKAIREASLFLACLSSRSVGKVGFVQSEFRQALSAFGERPPGSIYLIPVRLDECQVPDLQIPDRGLSFRDIHWVDLWEEDGFDRLLGAIERALSSPQAAREGAPPTAPFLEQEAKHRAEHEQPVPKAAQTREVIAEPPEAKAAKERARGRSRAPSRLQDPAMIAAVIGAIAVVIAGVLTSPLLDRFLPDGDQAGHQEEAADQVASTAQVREADQEFRRYSDTIGDGPEVAPPLAHWPLSEASGTQITDREGGARHGTVLGTIRYGAAGLPQNSEGAIDFAGTGYVTIPHDAGLALSAFSLSFWFRLNTLPSTDGIGWYVLISKDQSVRFTQGDFAVTVVHDGKLIVEFETGGGAVQRLATSPQALRVSTTYQLVVRADKTGFDAYLNGHYLGKNTEYTGAWASNTQPIHLGTVPWLLAQGRSPFDGILDEVALFDRVLTDAEVRQLARAQAPLAAGG